MRPYWKMIGLLMTLCADAITILAFMVTYHATAHLPMIVRFISSFAASAGLLVFIGIICGVIARIASSVSGKKKIGQTEIDATTME